jgi:hypothetical protein
MKLLPRLALILVMSFTHCGRQSPMLGLYDVTGHDTSGRLVFMGTISLLSLEQNHLKGKCTIKWEKDARDGALDEDGGCEGLIEGKVISIDTAPSMDHAGMLLDGEFNDGRITGTWRIDSFATSPPLGKFEAMKKN